MSNPWFRMYAEFAHDPKVQMLSETMQRRYVMLMCLRCSNALVTLHETEVAFALRISDEELASTKALFIAKGFIDSSWNLLNWEKRQFASDSSAARVAEHRRRKKEAEEAARNAAVTLQKRQANALDTDTDTDKKKKEKPSASAFQTFYAAYPKHEARKDAEAAFAKLNPSPELLAQMLAAIEARRHTTDWTKEGGKFVPLPATWLRGRRWEDAVAMDAGAAVDPDSRSVIEAEGVAMGIGKWNEIDEQWHAYKARVRGTGGGLDLGALASMAAQRQGAHA